MCVCVCVCVCVYARERMRVVCVYSRVLTRASVFAYARIFVCVCGDHHGFALYTTWRSGNEVNSLCVMVVCIVTGESENAFAPANRKWGRVRGGWGGFSVCFYGEAFLL